MIYAINKRTKEHRLVASMPDFSDGHYYVKADADGWIQHTGQGCPLPDGARYEVKNRDGEWGEGVVGKWVHGSYQREYDIIAYRPILDAETSEPEVPEWDGEGLPPVGCECEALELEDGEACWTKTTVIARSEGIVWLSGNGLQREDGLKFRPIRTPAQRAEEGIRRGIVEVLSVAVDEGHDVLDDDVCASVIASAIRDGKIPGVKLEN